MKITINSSHDYYHELTATLNGWSLDWFWYGSEDELRDVLDTIHDESLEEYIKFCSTPNDDYYYQQLA